MKLSELRELREAATPGRWEAVPSESKWRIRLLDNRGFHNGYLAYKVWEGDARLIALASDLARLVEELGGALQEITGLPPAGYTRVEHAGDIGMRERSPKTIANVALAKLEELGR